MSLYHCPFCHAEYEDGIENLIEHQKPGGLCDQLMEAQDTKGMQ